MAWWLVDRGMTLGDALQYLYAAAHVRLGNMFEPFYSAFVYLERSTLPLPFPRIWTRRLPSAEARHCVRDDIADSRPPANRPMRWPAA